MKSYRQELWFQVPGRRAFINITPQVEQCLRESGVTRRSCPGQRHAYYGLRSSSMTTNPGCTTTTRSGWKSSRPHAPVSQYRHNVGEDNADAHLKRQIMGREVVVAVTGGRLDFGPWEQIFYGEFDGGRKKTGAGEDHRGVSPLLTGEDTSPAAAGPGGPGMGLFPLRGLLRRHALLFHLLQVFFRFFIE